MDIEFPIEFLVMGTPASLQASARTISAWKQTVVDASWEVIENPHFASDEIVSVTIYNFPTITMQGDIDNIVKPILDALSNHVFIDDQQVERVVVQKFEPDRVFEFDGTSAVLMEALDALDESGPLVYIRVSTQAHEEWQ